MSKEMDKILANLNVNYVYGKPTETKKPTARIDELGGEALYIVIDGDEDTAWAINKNEVEAIMIACREYLERTK